jgi:hypothetical protein
LEKGKLVRLVDTLEGAEINWRSLGLALLSGGYESPIMQRVMTLLATASRVRVETSSVIRPNSLIEETQKHSKPKQIP